MQGVRVLSPDGALLHEGPIELLRDALAEELRCWWDQGEGLPPAVWDSLDLGVRRRLIDHPRFRDDPLVQAFAAARRAGQGVAG